VVRLTLKRPPAREPVEIATTLMVVPPEAPIPTARRLASELITVYAVPFIVVGLGVLFSRLHDRNAWLLALLFSSFAVGGPFVFIEGQVSPPLRGFALAWKILFSSLAAAFFYYFFAVFPIRSPLDRRLPWLKHALLRGLAAGALPLALWGLWAGSHSKPSSKMRSGSGGGGSKLNVIGACPVKPMVTLSTKPCQAWLNA
jgi:hypothetical protein